MATQVEEVVALEAETINDEEEEEALSLSDFPMEADPCAALEAATSPEFEFLTSRGSFGGSVSSRIEDTDMCAADEVFFQGQILPLRPSVSSDCSGMFQYYSLCGSRSESMDRSSAVGSLGIDSRSSSTGRSSSSTTSISRSHSIHSSTSGDSAARVSISISSNFYTHPSPKPHLPARNRHAPRRKSVSSSPRSTGVGWGIFRVGLVRGPEIELLQDPRHRRTPSVSSRSAGSSKRFDAAESKPEKAVVETTEDRGNGKSEKESKSKGSTGGKGKLQSTILRFFRNMLGCNCSQDDTVVPISSSASSSRTSDDKRSDQHGGVEEKCLGSRTFQWLEQLPVEKEAVV